MIDFKGGVEFGKQYKKYGEVVTERERALRILGNLVYKNQYRLTIFRDLEVKNLDEYSRKTNQHLCRIGVFIRYELRGVANLMYEGTINISV